MKRLCTRSTCSANTFCRILRKGRFFRDFRNRSGWKFERGCVWVADCCVLGGIIELINGLPVTSRDKMSVGIDRDLDGMVPELLFHLGEGFALLNEQAREGMAQIVNTDAPQPTTGQHGIEDILPYCCLNQQFSFLVIKYPFWHMLPSSLPCLLFARLKEG